MYHDCECITRGSHPAGIDLTTEIIDRCHVSDEAIEVNDVAYVNDGRRTLLKEEIKD